MRASLRRSSRDRRAGVKPSSGLHDRELVRPPQFGGVVRVLRQTHPRRQGDLGEAAAIAYLTEAGAKVLIPLFHSPDYDLVAEYEQRLLRVQVKTSTSRQNG